MKNIKDNQFGKSRDQPPKNNKEVKMANTTILPYSPKKNNAKVKEEYSTL